MSDQSHGHCIADGLDGAHQASLSVPGPIPTTFKQKHGFPGVSPLERGDPPSGEKEVGLETVWMKQCEPAELVVHEETSRLQHMT